MKEFDDIAAKKFIESVRAGNTASAATRAAGITTTVLGQWVGAAKGNVEPFAGFVSRYRKAEADAEGEAVAAVRDAAAKNWQAAAWWLERRRPRAWAKREAPEKEAPVNVSSMTPEQAEKRKQEIYAEIAASMKVAK